MDAASEVNYRRSVAMLTATDLDAPPFRTMHELGLRTSCDEIVIPRKVLREPITIFTAGIHRRR